MVEPFNSRDYLVEVMNATRERLLKFDDVRIVEVSYEDPNVGRSFECRAHRGQIIFVDVAGKTRGAIFTISKVLTEFAPVSVCADALLKFVRRSEPIFETESPQEHHYAPNFGEMPRLMGIES